LGISAFSTITRVARAAEPARAGARDRAGFAAVVSLRAAELDPPLGNIGLGWSSLPPHACTSRDAAPTARTAAEV